MKIKFAVIGLLPAYALSCLFILSGCTHVIAVNQMATEEVAGCRIIIEDRRTDKSVITAAPSSTYRMEYPIDKALRNRLCHTQLAENEMSVVLEEAKCRRVDSPSPGMTIQVTVDGMTRIKVMENADADSSSTETHCGLSFDNALDSIVDIMAPQIQSAIMP